MIRQGIFASAVVTGGGSSATIAYTDFGQNTGSSASYTFSARALGSASADRVIAVVVFHYVGGVSRSVTSVTVGGVAASLVTGTNPSSGRGVSIWYASVPSGTTGAVDVVFNNTVNNCGIEVYAMEGLASSTPFSQSRTSGAMPIGASVATTTGGVIISGVSELAPTTLIGWTNITINSDRDLGGNIRTSSANKQGTAGSENPIADNGLGSVAVLSIASWA